MIDLFVIICSLISFQRCWKYNKTYSYSRGFLHCETGISFPLYSYLCEVLSHRFDIRLCNTNKHLNFDCTTSLHLKFTRFYTMEQEIKQSSVEVLAISSSTTVRFNGCVYNHTSQLKGTIMRNATKTIQLLSGGKADFMGFSFYKESQQLRFGSGIQLSIYCTLIPFFSHNICTKPFFFLGTINKQSTA